MDEQLVQLIKRIRSLPDTWHSAGTVTNRLIGAIASRATEIGEIQHSVETGCGRTTLLLSHLSADHVVFARDVQNNVSELTNSISKVTSSALFNSKNVTLVEGPTQLTLAKYNFVNRVQLALIDGPHGYPFPDLEYYYFYPLVAPGGLLLLDDTQIPSIGRMYEIIKADKMFTLLEVVDNMAFFQRSNTPLIDPISDGWWLQGYNRNYYDELMGIARQPKKNRHGFVRRIQRALGKFGGGGQKEGE